MNSWELLCSAPISCFLCPTDYRWAQRSLFPPSGSTFQRDGFSFPLDNIDIDFGFEVTETWKIQESVLSKEAVHP